MTPFLQLVFVLVIVIFMAKFAGYVSTLLGQPSVLGELLIGIILGPSLLDLTHLSFITDTHLGEVIYEMGELGVLLLMFIAGMELHISELTRNTRASAYSGTLGVLAPVGLGMAAGLLIGEQWQQALFLGLTLGATSVSISAQTLIELRALRSRVGMALLGAAVFDDILVILLLSIFLALIGEAGSFMQVAWVVVKMILFLGLSAGFGIWVLPRFTRIIHRLPISQGVLAFAVIILLTYGMAAELLGGMAAITGTFLAGLMFSRMPEKKDIENGLRSLAYGFFVPIFFVSIGLGVNLSGLNIRTIWIALLVALVAILGKLIGAGLGARLGGLTWLESLQLSIGMVSRGEVGLIVAQLGLVQGLLDDTIFSVVVGMVLITTLVTPPLLRAAFQKSQQRSTASAPSD